MLQKRRRRMQRKYRNKITNQMINKLNPFQPTIALPNQ